MMTKRQLQDQQKNILSFKASKGFKAIANITDTYKMGKELGAGSFGTVNFATHRSSNAAVAIKIIKKQSLTEVEVY